ncbi:MAG: histidine kinase, partial [Blastocatellia bacterium]
LLAWHVAIVMGLGALILLRGRLNDFVTRFYAAATVVGAVIPALAMVTASPSSMSPPVLLVFCLLKEQSPLLILLGAIVFFSDFRFLNVYVKTSLQLLTGVAFALGFLLVMGRLKPLIGGVTQYQDAAAISLATALLVLFLWCFVWVGPILSRMVDRRLFGEPDYRAALRDLWEQLNNRGSSGNSTDHDSEDFAVYDGADEQERALDTISNFIRHKLELEQVQVVLTSALDADHLEATLSSGEVYELSCGDPVKSKVGAGVDFLAPIRVKGVPVYVIAVSPGALRRELLESEIRFLRAVAGQAGSRLEALQYEREKADRQSREERLRRQVTEAELRALRAQINPHFLFNSLNTIADLIVMDPAKADRMTVQLARVFRHILSNS